MGRSVHSWREISLKNRTNRVVDDTIELCLRIANGKYPPLFEGKKGSGKCTEHSFVGIQPGELFTSYIRYEDPMIRVLLMMTLAIGAMTNQSSGQDEKKKKGKKGQRNQTAQLLGRYKDVGVNEEQESKMKKIIKEFSEIFGIFLD